VRLPSLRCPSVARGLVSAAHVDQMNIANQLCQVECRPGGGVSSQSRGPVRRRQDPMRGSLPIEAPLGTLNLSSGPNGDCAFPGWTSRP
jgi:hypothetical protein